MQKKKNIHRGSRLVLGRKPLIEAMEGGIMLDKIFMLQTAVGEEIQIIRRQAKKLNIPLSLVPQEKLERLSKKNHQGVIAFAALIPFQPLQEIISQTVDKGETPFLVMVDGVTDTRNIGAIARSAWCYGAHALIIPASGNAAITEDAVKVSAGALEILPICRVVSIEQATDLLKLNGIKQVATAIQSNNYIHHAKLDVPICITLGAEDKGVSKFILKHADELLKIPMSNKFDSLNVSVAAGIIFYETHKQRHS